MAANPGRSLSGLGRSLVDRALDSTMGTGFHMFMILRECLYQLEIYAPRYGVELEQAERLEELSRRIGPALGEEEAQGMEHIRQIVKQGHGMACVHPGAGRALPGALPRAVPSGRRAAEALRRGVGGQRGAGAEPAAGEGGGGQGVRRGRGGAPVQPHVPQGGQVRRLGSVQGAGLRPKGLRQHRGAGSMRPAPGCPSFSWRLLTSAANSP